MCRPICCHLAPPYIITYGPIPNFATAAGHNMYTRHPSAAPAFSIAQLLFLPLQKCAQTLVSSVGLAFIHQSAK